MALELQALQKTEKLRRKLSVLLSSGQAIDVEISLPRKDAFHKRQFLSVDIAQVIFEVSSWRFIPSR